MIEWETNVAMERIYRQLAKRETGPMDVDEDWWHLVIDPESGCLYVEHSWHHIGGRGPASEGKRTISISDYLAAENGKGQKELRRIFSQLSKV